jgi:hypothetical protein
MHTRLAPPARAVALAALALGLAACQRAPLAAGDSAGPLLETVEADLSQAERMARYAQIRDAAAARGILRTSFLLGGIAHAETGLAHCWSEAQWACQGPDSADCGGGPVIAGAGDGPCADRQGGLGMFQFDAGTFDDTLGTYGPDVLLVAGNVSHALDFVIRMVKISSYTTNAETDEKSLQWIQNFDLNDATLRDQWISTVTRHYNGCRPDRACWNQRYAHYNESLQIVVDETGLDFWNVVPPPVDQPPQGSLDAAGCDALAGWAYDPDAPAAPIDVHVYFGGPAGSGAPSLAVRADVRSEPLCGSLGTCEHAFGVLPPLSLFDGGAHPIHVYGIGAEGGGNAELGGSPKPLQCAPDLPAGVRRHIVDEASAGAWRLDVFHDRLPADAAAIDGANTGDDLPAAPVLVRSDDGAPEVWVVDGDLRRHVQGPAVMAAWRFDWNAIQSWPAAQVQALAQGAPWRARPVEVATADGARFIVDDAAPAAPETPDAGAGAGGAPGPGTPDAFEPGLGGTAGGGGESGLAGGAGGFGGGGPEPQSPTADAGTGAYTGLRQAVMQGSPGCGVAPGRAPGIGPLVAALLGLASVRRRRANRRLFPDAEGGIVPPHGKHPAHDLRPY